MNCDKNSLLLYAVTDRAWLQPGETLLGRVRDAIEGGATFVQLREKDLDPAAFLAEGREIGALCREMGVPFVVDDDVDLALACGADGAHVGQSDLAAGEARKKLGPDKILGVSAQTVEQALAAERAGADYLGSGAAFATSTKDVSGQYVTPEGFAEITGAVKIPVVAIGGITKDNISELYGRGLAGVAVVSALFAQPDVEAAAREMRELCERL